ncbi:MAG: glutamine--fructose-6-phosphate transaminase (isomerizing) [Clostridia bacterium]|nr:glutamine--fructose-6-phosphate transaminase (isomerizing) [Clostridia bacterium]
MCGITGYIGNKNAAKIIYDGLIRLEYRGYDSVGIAVKNAHEVSILKRAGRVNCIGGEVENLKGKIGIGHTRWATHGKPCDENAHPHESCGVYLVHNGVIENYKELKSALESQGEKFKSQTDSEVIVKLIAKNYSGDLLKATAAAIKNLKGSFALLILSVNEERLIAVCNKSPVIIGRGKGENFVCSDAPALAGLCDNICVLNDGDIADITAEKVNFYTFDLVSAKREFNKNLATEACLDLGDCPHYMLKEIKEIPHAVKNTVNAVSSVDITELTKLILHKNRVIFLGCGTAYHAGLVAKEWVEDIAKIPASCETAGEWRYKNAVVDKNTLVVAISQSGETADTLQAVIKAKEMGAAVIAVTNVGYSAITRLSHFVLPVAAGAEICVAATKSYCGQLAALYLLTLILKFGLNFKNTELFGDIANMHALCNSVISSIYAGGIAKKFAKSNAVYFIGRGLDCSVAREGSLKLKEVSLKHSEGYPAGELKHGTLALIDEHTYTVAIICNEQLKYKTLSAIEQILSRGGRVVAVCADGDFCTELTDKVECVFSVPKTNKYLSPILSVIPLQMLAYYTALSCGCDPDKPRNLAKSVTVE